MYYKLNRQYDQHEEKGSICFLEFPCLNDVIYDM